MCSPINEKAKQRTGKFTTRELGERKNKQLIPLWVSQGARLHREEPVSPLRMDVVEEDKDFLGPGEPRGR